MCIVKCCHNTDNCLCAWYLEAYDFDTVEVHYILSLNLLAVTVSFFVFYVCRDFTTMFLRKLLNKNDAKPEQKTMPPPGMQTMVASLQKRFARGVQYNSKCRLM